MAQFISMRNIKCHNGANYAHAQVSNTSVSTELMNVHWTVIKGQLHDATKTLYSQMYVVIMKRKDRRKQNNNNIQFGGLFLFIFSPCL